MTLKEIKTEHQQLLTTIEQSISDVDNNIQERIRIFKNDKKIQTIQIRETIEILKSGQLKL